MVESVIKLDFFSLRYTRSTRQKTLEFVEKEKVNKKLKVLIGRSLRRRTEMTDGRSRSTLSH